MTRSARAGRERATIQACGATAAVRPQVRTELVTLIHKTRLQNGKVLDMRLLRLYAVL